MIKRNTSKNHSEPAALLCAFLLPALLMVLAYATAGIYPFGEKSLLIADMHNEYIDYLAQLNESVRQSGSFMRAWNMGLGLNMLGLIAFYTASPFNLLVLLLPLHFITEAVFAVTALKIGLGGLLFCIYARYVFPGAGRVFHVLFSVAYALMAYNIAYSSNMMWLDGTAFLPLVLLGAEKILRENKYGVFIASLVYVFFTSYYIGYMVGLFSFLYFTAVYFVNADSWRGYLKKISRFMGGALIAACCCAFLLIPAFLNLKNGQTELWNIPFSPELRYTGARLAAKLLPGAYDSLTDSGLPHIYCSVLAVFLLILFFITKAVKTREKFIFGLLLGFLSLCFSCGFLDLAWHAFEDPTWFPARYSFVFSFLVLHLALRCAGVFEKIGRRELAFAAGVLLLLLIEIGINRFWFAGLWQLAAGLFLLLLYLLLFAALQKKSARIVTAVLLLLVSMECFGNASAMIHGMDRQFGYKNRAEYRDFMDAYGAGVEAVKALDPGVYRMETVGQRGPNGGMALGYNGISHYSTTTDQALNIFLRKLGYNKGTVNELRFAPSTPATNGLLGIRYILSPRMLGEGYAYAGTSGKLLFLQNEAAWPLAFWAPESALSFLPEEQNPFALQNGYIRAALGEKAAAVFLPVAAGEARPVNAEAAVFPDRIEFTRQIRDQDAFIDYVIENPDEREVFAYFPVYNEKYSLSEVYVNGVLLQKDFFYRNNTVLALGKQPLIELKIVMGGDRLRIQNAYFAALDIDAARRCAIIANERQMEFTAFLDTRVEGTVTAPESGALATTFPYDAGWRVFVDGKRVKPIRFTEVFMAIPLEQGEHEIRMKYASPGFLPGFAVSAITLAGLFIRYLRHRNNTISNISFAENSK